MLEELTKRLAASSGDCPYPPTVLLRVLSRVMNNRRRYALRHASGSGDEENIPPAAGVIPPAHALLLLLATWLSLAVAEAPPRRRWRHINAWGVRMGGNMMVRAFGPTTTQASSPVPVARLQLRTRIPCAKAHDVLRLCAQARVHYRGQALPLAGHVAGCALMRARLAPWGRNVC
jgi:hypothetical protein